MPMAVAAPPATGDATDGAEDSATADDQASAEG